MGRGGAQTCEDVSLMNCLRLSRSFPTLGGFVVVWLLCLRAIAVDISLPPETGVFKQDTGAEIANGQCLICHSVEYVTMQPPMPRAFWMGSVQKMQQKYGAPIPDADVGRLVDYLTRNYGATTNGSPQPPSVPTTQPANQTINVDGSQLAVKYGCFGCHNTAIKVVGPAYREIAAKYKIDPDAFAKISGQIHQGGSGKWGPIIMPPFPQVTPAEAKALADWILGLK